MPGIKETVVEVSEKFLNRHDRKRALELKETGHNISQIAEIMGRTHPLVNRLLNPEHQYYQTAGTRAEIHRRMKLYEHLAVEGLKLKAKGLSIQEICGELKTRRDPLLRAFDMAKDQGWDLMAGENAG